MAHYYQLQNTLISLNQGTDQLINEYYTALQPIWTQLNQIKISQDHLCLFKILIELRLKCESVHSALLHRNPLPSLDAKIQEILFEEKKIRIIGHS